MRFPAFIFVRSLAILHLIQICPREGRCSLANLLYSIGFDFGAHGDIFTSFTNRSKLFKSMLLACIQVHDAWLTASPKWNTPLSPSVRSTCDTWVRSFTVSPAGDVPRVQLWALCAANRRELKAVSWVRQQVLRGVWVRHFSLFALHYEGFLTQKRSKKIGQFMDVRFSHRMISEGAARFAWMLKPPFAGAGGVLLPPPHSFSSLGLHACMLSCFICALLFMTPWIIGHQAHLSMGFPRQEYRSGLPCPPPGNLPNPEIKPESLMSPELAGGFFTTSATGEVTPL